MKFSVNIKGVAPAIQIQNMKTVQEIGDWLEVRDTGNKVWRFMKAEIQWTVEEP